MVMKFTYLNTTIICNSVSKLTQSANQTTQQQMKRLRCARRFPFHWLLNMMGLFRLPNRILNQITTQNQQIKTNQSQILSNQTLNIPVIYLIFKIIPWLVVNKVMAMATFCLEPNQITIKTNNTRRNYKHMNCLCLNWILIFSNTLLTLIGLGIKRRLETKEPAWLLTYLLRLQNEMNTNN